MFRIDKTQITITQGDDASFKVHLYDKEKEEQEIDGTLKMTVKGSSQLFQKTSTDGYFTIGSSDTSSADAGIYNYDIQYTTSTGNIETVAKGIFIILGDITQ